MFKSSTSARYGPPSPSRALRNCCIAFVFSATPLATLGADEIQVAFRPPRLKALGGLTPTDVLDPGFSIEESFASTLRELSKTKRGRTAPRDILEGLAQRLVRDRVFSLRREAFEALVNRSPRPESREERFIQEFANEFAAEFKRSGGSVTTLRKERLTVLLDAAARRHCGLTSFDLLDVKSNASLRIADILEQRDTRERQRISAAARTVVPDPEDNDTAESLLHHTALDCIRSAEVETTLGHLVFAKRLLRDKVNREYARFAKTRRESVARVLADLQRSANVTEVDLARFRGLFDAFEASERGESVWQGTLDRILERDGGSKPEDISRSWASYGESVLLLLGVGSDIPDDRLLSRVLSELLSRELRLRAKPTALQLASTRAGQILDPPDPAGATIAQKRRIDAERERLRKQFQNSVAKIRTAFEDLSKSSLLEPETAVDSFSRTFVARVPDPQGLVKDEFARLHVTRLIISIGRTALGRRKIRINKLSLAHSGDFKNYRGSTGWVLRERVRGAFRKILEQERWPSPVLDHPFIARHVDARAAEVAKVIAELLGRG